MLEACRGSTLMEGLRLNLVMDGDIIRVKVELRRAAVAAVVILAKLRGARATTLRTFDSFDMLGHSVYELCKEVCLGERAHTIQGEAGVRVT